jgi:hypothetical protein
MTNSLDKIKDKKKKKETSKGTKKHKLKLKLIGPPLCGNLEICWVGLQ